MKLLIIINILFAFGLGCLLALDITSNPVWLIFIASWCIAEGILAKDHNIKWWQWMALLLSLAGLDGLILLTFG